MEQAGMSSNAAELAPTVRLMRPIVPVRDLEVSRRFYVNLGFQSHMLTDNLVEMRLGACVFTLQGCYVQQWADNFVMHLLVSDLSLWWNHIVSLDLPSATGASLRRRRAWKPRAWLPA